MGCKNIQNLFAGLAHEMGPVVATMIRETPPMF